MSVQEQAEVHFAAWYGGLRHYSGGFPARGTVGGALVVLEQLKMNFDTEINTYTARGGSQITGASGLALATILARFGETRPFLSEGGRTNRGLRGDIASMLTAIEAASLGLLPADERNDILEALQEFLIQKVRDFHNRQRLSLTYNPTKSTWQFVRDLLSLARILGKEGQVAQHIVGAKLQLRFPSEVIDNYSYSTADQHLGRPGDFIVGRTAFHVTVSPMTGVYGRCRANVDAGYGVYLLVPEHGVVGAKQNAEAIAPGQIGVQSIESFVAQNLDELAIFGKEDRRAQLRQLIEIYNQRVDAIELDKSLLMELPSNLAI